MRDEWMRGKRAVLFTGAEPLECTEGREPQDWTEGSGRPRIGGNPAEMTVGSHVY